MKKTTATVVLAATLASGVIPLQGPWSSACAAQLLDLDSTTPPDETEAAEQLAKDLSEARDSIQSESAIDDDAAIAMRLQRAWLLLASECALAGADAGPRGSGLIVLARTMGKLSEDVRLAATRRLSPSAATATDPSMIDGATNDLEQAVRGLVNASGLTPHRDTLRTIRNAMTPVLGTLEDNTSETALAEIDADQNAELTSLKQAIATGLAWKTLAPSAARLEEAINAAAPREPDQPADAPMHARLDDEFNRAITNTDPDAMMLDLDTVALARSFVPRLRDMGGNENNKLAQQLVKAIPQREGPPARHREGTRLANELIKLLEARDDLPPERDLIREVTAASRALTRDLRPVEIASREAIDVLVRDRNASADPAVLATLRAHRRAIETLEGLERLSGFLVSGSTSVNPLYLGAAQRAQAIGRELTVRRSDDPTASARDVELLRDMIADTDAMVAMNADATAALSMMPKRAQSIRYRIESLPSRVMIAWGVAGGTGPGSELRQEMNVLTTTIRLAADAAASRDRRLDAWQGWELSDSTHEAMRLGIDDAFDEALRRAVNSDRYDENALKLVLETKERFGVAMLEGRLLREGGAPRATGDPLEEAVLGPLPHDAWLLQHRQGISEVCRYAEEWALSIADLEQATGDARAQAEAREAKLRRYIAGRTAELLTAIPAQSANENPN